MEQEQGDEQQPGNDGQQPSLPSPGATAATTRLRELSTAQQSAWVERIFARFAAIYGRTFADLWEGIHPYEVKREWCDSLAPFTGMQLAWAVEACKSESDLAPTLPRFLRLCSQAPRPPVERQEVDWGTAPMSADVKRMLDATLKQEGEMRLELRAAWAIENLRYIAGGSSLPAMVERFSVEGLYSLGAMHLAPAEYVALKRPAWQRFARRAAA